MQIEFTKMQGCGNDYVYIDGSRYCIPKEKKPEFVKRMSDRHFGVGSDGVIFVNPSTEASFEMEMWNADGTRSQMCGNGIRCVGKFVYEKGLTTKTEFSVISAGAIKKLQLFCEHNDVKNVRVNMGQPILKACDIPVISNEEVVIHQEITVKDKEYRMTCVSLGNPHAVVMRNEIKDLDLETIGPIFEHHKMFPERVNTEFVHVIDRTHIEMRVWERGSGETFACGTGCCASVVACVLNGLTEPKVTVSVLGGSLDIEWNQESNELFMSGPAVTVFEGTWNEEMN